MTKIKLTVKSSFKVVKYYFIFQNDFLACSGSEIRLQHRCTCTRLIQIMLITNFKKWIIHFCDEIDWISVLKYIIAVHLWFFV